MNAPVFLHWRCAAGMQNRGGTISIHDAQDDRQSAETIHGNSDRQLGDPRGRFLKQQDSGIVVGRAKAATQYRSL